jgi:hypothetical protein
MSKALFLVILLITNICLAKVKGHIKPFKEELLQNPITLDCGVVIVENIEYYNGQLVSRELSDKDIKTLNAVCSKVINNYNQFISSHQMGQPKSTERFHWEASLLPATKDYRCLNDTTYRFYYRKLDKGNVIVDGYTDSNQWRTFSLSNRYSKFFKTVFAHEVFHALNYFYAVVDTEALAEEFTAQLGYGK